jgi:hypothetical protein
MSNYKNFSHFILWKNKILTKSDVKYQFRLNLLISKINKSLASLILKNSCNNKDFFLVY